jgi:ribonucleoside-diphosphate reductase alpha chain
MVALSCEHPDIEEFLKIKQTDHKLEAMNISMLLTSKFMDAIKENKPFELHFDVPESKEKIRKTIDTRKFYREFCQTQWDYGDPGSIFIDRVRSYNLLSGYPEYVIDVSNPCAEFYGNAYNSCNLGSINLYHMVDDKFSPNAAINYAKLNQTVDTAIRCLDEILDYGYDMQPLDENRKCIDDWRSIGLGIMGLADMFVALGLRYGSPESRKVAGDLMKSILKQALITSCDLARTKGAFGKYDWEKTSKSPLIQLFPELHDRIKKYGLRNGTLLSIAPTGSLSLLAGGFSGGVEPIYQISMQRTTHSLEKEHKSFRVFARSIQDLLTYHHLPLDTPDAEVKVRFPFVIESHDVAPADRVELQSVLQTYVDNAISSTVNLKESATVEEIEQIYMMAYEKGCKGLTVFRDNCKRGSILDATEKNETIVLDSVVPSKRHDIRRIDGSTYRQSSACIKNFYITVNKTEVRSDLRSVHELLRRLHGQRRHHDAPDFAAPALRRQSRNHHQRTARSQVPRLSGTAQAGQRCIPVLRQRHCRCHRSGLPRHDEEESRRRHGLPGMRQSPGLRRTLLQLPELRLLQMQQLRKR